MNRAEMFARLQDKNFVWDMVIIGGGATGVGTAIEAASRGYNALLLEQSDFGKGTSSRSTKLIHGGVRYLKQGNISLVLEALKERGILHRNAPHLVHNLPFIVPSYDWWEGPFYGIGLKLYDLLAGKEGFGDSRILSREETLHKIPTIETEGLRGGVIYYDGQFDDARLIINMVQTAFEQGASLINYMPVTGFLKDNGLISGIVAHDHETGIRYRIRARCVINAAGVYSDGIRQMDDPEERSLISPSQGVHIVLDQSFLPGDSAIMIPETDDGRVLFAIPWHGRVIVGTTDTPVQDIPLEPIPMRTELEFLLNHAARYLRKDPTEKDVLSVFAGLRPLVNPQGNENTASISRDHTIHISRSGLITIAGGKWTTYRKMAEDTVDHAALIASLVPVPSVTSDLPIHGFHHHSEKFGSLTVYGSDAPAIQDMISNDPAMAETLHPDLDIVAAQVIWAVEHEMARTVEDFLSRRTRALLLDARASISAAPPVAGLMASALGQTLAWQKTQVENYTKTARNYLISRYPE
jgi:glycerol-3-phosphate dehydrogenase